jgi:hypothetical protein
MTKDCWVRHQDKMSGPFSPNPYRKAAGLGNELAISRLKELGK